MFRREDHRAEPRLLRHTSPLPGVEFRGRKDGGRFLAVPPLAIGEGVHAEVDEHRELIALPLQLGGGRHGPDPAATAATRRRRLERRCARTHAGLSP